MPASRAMIPAFSDTVGAVVGFTLGVLLRHGGSVPAICALSMVCAFLSFTRPVELPKDGPAQGKV